MRRRGLRRGTSAALLLAATGGFLPWAGRAETLTEAWQLALAHDPGLAAAGAERAAAEANERAARGARWPSVEASTTYARLGQSPALEVATVQGASVQSVPLFRDNQYLTGNVQLRLPLYTGGQITAGIAAAHSATAGASELEGATAATLRLNVAAAYVGVLRARRALAAQLSSVESLSAHVGDVQHLVSGESVPVSDLLAARVALANAEQARVRAANAVDMAQAAYNRLLGEPLERVPQLDEHVPVDAALAAQPVERLVRSALAAREELKGLAAQADALAAQSRAELARALPQLALVGNYLYLDNQFLDRQDVTAVGIGFTWSLFDGGQARNRADALRSASRAQQRRLEDLRAQIALEVRESWLGVQEAQARLKASQEAVAQAEENLRMSRELYGAGLATSTQVLDAVALRVGAVGNRDNAQLDESLARLQLARAVGTL